MTECYNETVYTKSENHVSQMFRALSLCALHMFVLAPNNTKLHVYRIFDGCRFMNSYDVNGEWYMRHVRQGENRKAKWYVPRVCVHCVLCVCVFVYAIFGCIPVHCTTVHSE